MKEKDIILLKNPSDPFDHNVGLVYDKIQTNYFELLLCSTNYDQISQEDIVIPTSHSDLRYSLVVNSDLIFPLSAKDKNILKKIGAISDQAIDEIRQLRGDNSDRDKLKISFQIGSPIYYKSDRRYSIKIKNLQLIDYYSKDSFEKLLLKIPDNVVSFINFKADKSIFDALIEQKSDQKVDLTSRQLLALADRKIDIEKYFLNVELYEIIFSSLNIKKLEKDIKKIVIAA